jgi:hypothetical protein
MREEARETWELLKGKRASVDDLEVHHKIPLEWDHLFDGHPNRLDNLLGVPKDLHQQTVTPFWNSWRASLGGRTPTPQEVLDKVAELEKQYGHLFEGLP